MASVLRPGIVVADRYYVESIVGIGGMGAVYRAVHVHLQKPVALKVLTSGSDERTVRRLVQEGIALARVRHRAIVDVYDAGTLDGQPWLAMELLEGETLGARISRVGRIEPHELIVIATELLGGLAVAHGAGIVHRDIKPENVFLARTGDGDVQPKLLDFGIALLRTVSRHTSEGNILGTAYYLSPEQARGDVDIDGRADLYALGVVLYEALTGARPFDAPTFTALVARILFDAPPRIEDSSPDVPAVLASVVNQCLAKDRNERPSDARSLRELLRSARASMPGQPFVTIADAPSEKERAPAHTMALDASASRDPFVGRERELGEIRGLLASGHRVVTLLGPGGTGKSRLASRVAREWRHSARPAGGVVTVELGEARTADAVLEQVARALELPLASPSGAESAVANAITTRGPMLLVLDGCEQVGKPLATFVTRWLDAAPGLQILATSLVPLRVVGERPFDLDPLSDEDAVHLFVQRATAVRRGASELDEGLVRHVVRRLEGIPLAIELAAARLSVMTLEQLAGRLDQRLRLLTSQRADVPARQATMRAAIDWSWELCGDAERDALAQCSVFHGGFDLDAAEAVVDLSRHPGAPWAADVLGALRDRSLVRSHVEKTSEGERVRLSLLETIREYAEEKLVASGASDATHERHARHYVRTGRELVAGIRRGRASASRKAISREEANLLAVADDAIARPTEERAAYGLEALAVLDETMGYRYPASLLDRMDALLAKVDRARVDPGALGRAVAARTRMRAVRDDARCVPDLEEALALGRKLGDAEIVRTCLVSWGALEYRRGRLDRADELLAEALRLSATEPWWHARTLVLVGYVRWHRGDVDTALEAARWAWQAARDSGDRGQEAYALSSLGLYEMQKGNVDQALAYDQQALALAREEDRRDMELMNVHNIGFCLHEMGKHDEAASLYEQAVQRARVTGHRSLEGIARSNRAVVDIERGRLETARPWLLGGIEMLRAANDSRFLGYYLAWLAVLDALEGNIPSAMQGLASATSTVAPLGDRLIAAAVDVLGAAADEMRARTRAREGDVEGARVVRAAARARVDAFRSLGNKSDLVRMSVRFATKTLG
ncbi:MAG: protein kinase [Deltaproteobacteria bacterium]|nr:protein kinase [Deltaproteobacteria bacterium]